MLLDNDKHRRMHSLGPKDCKFGSKRHGVMMVSITKSTLDNEQMSVSVPIFDTDSRADVDDRVGMALSFLQERQDDANQAWLLVDAERKQEQGAIKKKE